MSKVKVKGPEFTDNYEYIPSYKVAKYFLRWNIVDS